jgi:hypothetical protein
MYTLIEIRGFGAFLKIVNGSLLRNLYCCGTCAAGSRNYPE